MNRILFKVRLLMNGILSMVVLISCSHYPATHYSNVGSYPIHPTYPKHSVNTPPSPPIFTTPAITTPVVSTSPTICPPVSDISEVLPTALPAIYAASTPNPILTPASAIHSHPLLQQGLAQTGAQLYARIDALQATITNLSQSGQLSSAQLHEVNRHQNALRAAAQTALNDGQLSNEEQAFFSNRIEDQLQRLPTPNANNVCN